MPTILHADMDAFYASIEQRDHPQLQNQPVIVGGTGRRGVVAAASYEARRFGVRSAMPTARAKELCPKAHYMAPRMSVYVQVSQQIRQVFDSFTPLVEPLSLDEAFLDVTGSHALFGSGEEIAQKLKVQVKSATGLTISVGVAACKYVAKVASDLQKPDGLVLVPAGTEIGFLAPLSLSRLWGVGPKSLARLQGLGFSNIGDLQKLDLKQMQSLLGQNQGEHYHQLCRGLDDRAVSPERQVKSVSHEQTFQQDLRGPDACGQVLLRLSELVGRRLRRQGLRGRTVCLKRRDPNFNTQLRQAKLPAASDDDLGIYQLAMQLWEGMEQPQVPVRLLGVAVRDLETASAPAQGGLFAPEPGKSKELSQALDRIRDRFGEDAIQHGLGDL